MTQRIGVVGGGLAGIAAALTAADAGAQVVLFERRRTLGGLTTSIERNGRWFDNGQHVFLRCCTAYLAFLERIGGTDQVRLQRRLDVMVLAPGGVRASIRRTSLPAPLHLAASLARYRHLSVRERLRLAAPVLALRRLNLDDPSLDLVAFGDWLAARGQSPRAVERLWDLIVRPTVNTPAADASLALAAKVFREGLLDRADAGDIGWSLVPLAHLHGDTALRALAASGVEVRLATQVDEVASVANGVALTSPSATTTVDAAIIAVPPTAASTFGLLRDDVTDRLGSQPIVNVHLLLDRRVTDLELFAAVDSPIQFVFDRTASSGVTEGQCLVVSLSAADEEFSRGSSELVATMLRALGELLPAARSARLLDAVVTRERAATFRGTPGSGAMRPSAATTVSGVFLAGAWCATGWPATMEGAVRSGNAAARQALVRVAGAGASELATLSGSAR